MIRKLSLAVAVATALSPLGVFALGLGDIHTHSALNQRFKADIDLVSVTREELPDIRVGLASPEAFTKAGIERPFLLSGLKFTPALAPDGRLVIAVSSQEPIREPFLNFLLEVNWPKGRMMREFTVLLDPPVTLARKPAPIQAPRVTAVPSRQLAQARNGSAAVVRESFPATVSQTGGAREYGPVQLNDNLWVIAETMQQQGETVEQVMIALQQHNADAFIRNNVNGLKVGKILRLPEDVDVTGLSSREARREFLAQTREWREHRAKPLVDAVTPQLAQEQTEPVKTSETKDRLELIAAKPEAADEGQAGEGKAENRTKIARLEQEVILIREESESARQENEVLQARVRELEAQIGDIQRLLTLKNDQLAELQTTQQVVAEKTEALEATRDEAQMAEEPELAGKPEADVEAPKEGGGVIEEVDIESIVMEAMQSDTTPSAEMLAEKTAEPAKLEQPAIPSPMEPVAVTPSTVDSKQSTAPKPISVDKPKQGGFLDILTGNSTLMGLVGAVLVLLSSLLWLIMRRRKEAEAEFAESILVTPEGVGVASTVQNSAGAVNEPSEETSFMSDFSPSDIDALQDETGEVDPLSEADVYIAYGRYQQAEELIRQAIEKFPEREELKHKLLEIYYSAKNSPQFTRVAEELQQAGLEKDQPDTWAKIARMGKELDPGNTLFALASGAAIGVGLETMEEELDDLGLDLNSDLLEGDDTPSSGAVPEQSLDFEDELSSMDLSDLSSLNEMDSESIESSMSLDSEFLNSLEDDQNFVADQTNEESKALDIDLVAMEEVADSDQAQGQALDFASTLDGLSEISGLDLSPSNEAASELTDESDQSNVVSLEGSESFDDFDLESLEKELELLSGDLDESLDEESATDELNLSEELNAQAEGVDLDSTDEVTTKLDLAHAYVDMGDAEGAKNILEEVVTEGSDKQKQQAQEMLGMIAS